MIRNIVTIAFLFSSINLSAQEIQGTINEQVWKPFIEAFNGYDTEAFMAIHSNDVIRSSRDSKTILNWSGYRKQMLDVDNRSRERGATRIIELRFLERISSTDAAIDIGIYKTTNTDPAGKVRSSYGRFHVVLRKENGQWRILVDMDSSENRTVDEEDFMAALPME